MFNTDKSERLAKWREFRDNLEKSATPLEDVVELWSNAPFVYSYLDPFDSSKWPDPWHLVLDLKLDNIAIPLGMLYTLKLTKRFADTKCEIFMLTLPTKDWSAYYLLVDSRFVLNLEHGKVVDIEVLSGHEASIIYPDRKFL